MITAGQKRTNLLPKLKQRELVHERVFHAAAVAAVIAIIILLLGVVMQFGVWSYLNRRLGSLDAEIEQMKRLADRTENAAVKNQIRLVNSHITDFTELSNQTPQWATVIGAFMQHVPTSVKITQLDANTKTGEITIAGYSPTRDLVIDLYNNINTDKDNFKSINYPLENVSRPTDVRFSFTFTVADGVLLPKTAASAPAPSAKPAPPPAPEEEL